MWLRGLFHCVSIVTGCLWGPGESRVVSELLGLWAGPVAAASRGAWAMLPRRKPSKAGMLDHL